MSRLRVTTCDQKVFGLFLFKPTECGKDTQQERAVTLVSQYAVYAYDICNQQWRPFKCFSKLLMIKCFTNEYWLM